MNNNGNRGMAIGHIRNHGKAPGNPSLVDVARLLTWLRDHIRHRVGVSLEVDPDEQGIPLVIWFHVVFKIKGEGLHVSKQIALVNCQDQPAQTTEMEAFAEEVNNIIASALVQKGATTVDQAEKVSPFTQIEKRRKSDV